MCELLIFRGIDPSIDMANYDWSPFKHPDFVLPVLSELSDWRNKLGSIKKKLYNQTLSVVFVADFPGNVLQGTFSQVAAGRLAQLLNTSLSVRRSGVRFPGLSN